MHYWQVFIPSETTVRVSETTYSICNICIIIELPNDNLSNVYSLYLRKVLKIMDKNCMSFILSERNLLRVRTGDEDYETGKNCCYCKNVRRNRLTKSCTQRNANELKENDRKKGSEFRFHFLGISICSRNKKYRQKSTGGSSPARFEERRTVAPRAICIFLCSAKRNARFTRWYSCSVLRRGDLHDRDI